MHGSSPCRRNTTSTTDTAAGSKASKWIGAHDPSRTSAPSRSTAGILQPVTAQHLPDWSGPTRRGREDRDTPTAELLDGCKNAAGSTTRSTPHRVPSKSVTTSSIGPPTTAIRLRTPHRQTEPAATRQVSPE